MALGPRASGKLISELSNHVKIKSEGIEKLGKKILEELENNQLSVENFSQNGFHPSANDPWAADWIFVVDTLNFCFWTPENKPKWTVEGQTGYFALCNAINRAIKEGIDVTNPKYYSKIKENELGHILRSDNEITVPLLKERVNCLNEVGEILLKKYKNSFKDCVLSCENSAAKLLQLILIDFPCFRDEAVYKNNKVSFYKRAQILVGDIWACFHNKGLGYFIDIDEITMFADYRVPQTLLYYGAIEYSNKLQKALNNNDLLENGSEMEIEIRGISIHAVELLKEWIIKNSKGININAILIDHYLWDFRRKNAKEIENLKIPFHKTISIYY